MERNDSYKNWKAVTEADFVSLFIKTWFAYISTLRIMYPEAYNRRGDKKYLNRYKEFYRTEGYKKFNVDKNVMASIEKVYQEGRNVIINNYPEYYLWDFYKINENFEFSYRQVPPDRSECFIVGLKMHRNRGTKWSFIVHGFIRLFGKYYGESYDANIQFQANISDVLKGSEQYVAEHPDINEQNYLAWLLREINIEVTYKMTEAFEVVIKEKKYGKRVTAKINDLMKQAIATVWAIFSLNAKDESSKIKEEMEQSRNTYEIIRQRPLNYFIYHMDVKLKPERAEMTASEERWYEELQKDLEKDSVLWFLDFIYRLRNALFHEIIDPLDEEWQIIFKNAYLVLKEIVDLNIGQIQEGSEQPAQD